MIELGLQRISRLLATTEFSWRAIHVAGTNGKGTICHHISGMLAAYNASDWRKHMLKPTLKHGRFTSPHLIDRHDCITVNGKTVSLPVFREAENKVFARNKQEDIQASEFELLTATAFEVFAQERLDVGVVEVGMGGAQDATNVFGLSQSQDARSVAPPPLVTVISSIGLDHQAFLGDTLETIAEQKAGIIKPGVPVVYDDSNDLGVIDVIRSVAAKVGSPIIDTKSLPEYPTPGPAAQNARLALAATKIALQRLDLLESQVVQLDPQKTAERAAWLDELSKDMMEATERHPPGRQQLLDMTALTGRKESVLLDGAHNASSAQSLASKIEELGYRRTSDGQDRSVTWVIATSDSKDAKEILSPLLKDGDVILAVEFEPVDGMPWVKALPASKLLDAAKALVPNSESLAVYDCGADVKSALEHACQKADGGPLVIAGSLYLVGDVLRLLKDAVWEP